MAKRRGGRYPTAFRQSAGERLTHCETIVALSKELGVDRRLLSWWRDQLEPAERGDRPLPANARESTRRKEGTRLKRVLAEKTLEVDLFTGALRTVKARRQPRGDSGGTASTPTSGT